MTDSEFKAARQKLGLSMPGMGKALGGYSKDTVAAWEYGRNPIPKAVVKLIAVLLALQS